MLLKTLLLAAISSVSLAAVNDGSLAIVKADFEAAGLIGDEFQAEDFDNLEGLFYVKFDGQDEPVTQGQRLEQDAVQEKPEFRYLPKEGIDTAGLYTLALIDADYNGADQSEGQTRHFLENDVITGGGDPDSDRGIALKDEESGRIITSYAGPGPAEGSGPHRYQFLLLKQPEDFQAPEGLDDENTPLGKMNIADYIDSTNSQIVAATYFIVEVGESTVDAKPTSTVNSSSVSATPSSTAGAGDGSDGSDSGDGSDGGDTATDGDSSSTRAAISMAAVLALIGTTFVFI